MPKLWQYTKLLYLASLVINLRQFFFALPVKGIQSSICLSNEKNPFAVVSFNASGVIYVFSPHVASLFGKLCTHRLSDLIYATSSTPRSTRRHSDTTPHIAMPLTFCYVSMSSYPTDKHKIDHNSDALF